MLPSHSRPLSAGHDTPAARAGAESSPGAGAQLILKITAEEWRRLDAAMRTAIAGLNAAALRNEREYGKDSPCARADREAAAALARQSEAIFDKFLKAAGGTKVNEARAR